MRIVPGRGRCRRIRAVLSGRHTLGEERRSCVGALEQMSDQPFLNVIRRVELCVPPEHFVQRVRVHPIDLKLIEADSGDPLQPVRIELKIQLVG